MGYTRKFIDSYELRVNDIIIDISIYSDVKEPVPIYNISITNISETTKIILEKIREEFVSEGAQMLEGDKAFEASAIQEQFKKSPPSQSCLLMIYHQKKIRNISFLVYQRKY